MEQQVRLVIQGRQDLKASQGQLALKGPPVTWGPQGLVGHLVLEGSKDSLELVDQQDPQDLMDNQANPGLMGPQVLQEPQDQMDNRDKMVLKDQLVSLAYKGQLVK